MRRITEDVISPWKKPRSWRSHPSLTSGIHWRGPHAGCTTARRADALAADANKLLATTETLLGSGLVEKKTTPAPAPTPQETDRKIEMIYGPQPKDDGMLFVVRARGANNVRLAGDFNDWNPDRTPLQQVRNDVFQVQLPLAPGKYGYRYVVDGCWLNDPENAFVEANPYGELNSIVEVG